MDTSSSEDDPSMLGLSPLICKGCSANTSDVMLRDSGPSCLACYEWFISFTPTVTVKTEFRPVELSDQEDVSTEMESSEICSLISSSIARSYGENQVDDDTDTESLTESDDDDDDDCDEAASSSTFPNRSIRALLAKDLNIHLEEKKKASKNSTSKKGRATSSSSRGVRGRPRGGRGRGAGRGRGRGRPRRTACTLTA